jgi:hypothetical protein
MPIMSDFLYGTGGHPAVRAKRENAMLVVEKAHIDD